MSDDKTSPKREGPTQPGSTAQQQSVSDEVAKIIRSASAEGRIIPHDEILKGLFSKSLLCAGQRDEPLDPDGFIEQSFDVNDDLRVTYDEKGRPWYYSALSMTDTYAGIMLGKEGNPLRLIARTVRESSELYPRPVPLGMFLDPPFGLTGEEIATCIAQAESREEFSDIRRTITSAGNTYLYSRDYLEPDHAAMLAEWLDVGQSENP